MVEGSGTGACSETDGCGGGGWGEGGGGGGVRVDGGGAVVGGGGGAAGTAGWDLTVVQAGQLQVCSPGYSALRASFEHLRCTHFEQVEHRNELCPTFPPQTEQGKDGPGFGSTPDMRRRILMRLLERDILLIIVHREGSGEGPDPSRCPDFT